MATSPYPYLATAGPLAGLSGGGGNFSGSLAGNFGGGLGDVSARRGGGGGNDDLQRDAGLAALSGGSSSLVDIFTKGKLPFSGLFGGDDKPKAPMWQRLAKREIAQGNAVLAAYNALYEPTLALSRQSASDYGDLYRRSANEALSHEILSSTAKREADLSDYFRLGPELLNARRTSDPLFGQAYDMAQRDISEAEAPLPSNVRRDISQGVLQSLNERGMSLGGAGAFEEALALAMGGEDFRSRRRSQAFGEASTLASMYGDPFQSLTGRTARPAPQGANVMSPDYGGFNENLFSYGVNRELQSRNIDAASDASNKAMIGSILQGLLSGAGGMAAMGCWVARAVFGESDPRWQLFRTWLYQLSPGRFFVWYLKHGPAFAAKLRDPARANTKARLQRWMEARIATLNPITA